MRKTRSRLTWNPPDSHPAAAPAQQDDYPDPGGKHYGSLAQRVIAPIAREYRGHHVGYACFP